MNTPQRPIHELRIGLTKAAIWRNQNDQQRSWFSVSFSRSYKSGTEWKSTSTFNLTELLEVGKLADMAHTWIMENQRQDTMTGGGADEPEEAIPAAPAAATRPGPAKPGMTARR